MQDTKIIIGDARNIDLAQFDKYGVIVADPPWAYDVKKRGTPNDYYSFMCDQDIEEMPISLLACDNSVLLLWGTWPKLPVVLNVMNKWGFEYVTGFPWIKMKKNGSSLVYGTGHWIRGCSEYVFIGRRGNVSAPRHKGFLGIISPNLNHSRKPEDIYEIAESLPGPYLELFARRSRKNWHSFGNEINDLKTGEKHTSSGKININPVSFLDDI